MNSMYNHQHKANNKGRKGKKKHGKKVSEVVEASKPEPKEIPGVTPDYPEDPAVQNTPPFFTDKIGRIQMKKKRKSKKPKAKVEYTEFWKMFTTGFIVTLITIIVWFYFITPNLWKPAEPEIDYFNDYD